MTPNPDLQRLADTSAAARPAALWDWLADVTRPRIYDREPPIRSDLLAHAAALNPKGPVWLKARTRLDALAPALDWMAVEGRSFGRIAADTVTGRGPFPPGLLDALDPDAWSAWHQRLTTEMQATEPDKLESPEAVQAWHRRGAKIIGEGAAAGVLATVLRVEADRLPGLVESGEPYEPALSPLLQNWYTHGPQRVAPNARARPLLPTQTPWLPRERQPEGAHLQQFTSPELARKLVERRAEAESKSLSIETICSKANGIASAMRGALDYIAPTPRDALNRRIVGLYYGAMVLAQAEMLALPSGPTDLDQVEAMTTRGHGLFALPMPQGGFADLHVGVLKSGFFGEWMKFLGHDTSDYPTKRPRSEDDLKKYLPTWPVHFETCLHRCPRLTTSTAKSSAGRPAGSRLSTTGQPTGGSPRADATARKKDGTYAQFIDRSGQVPVERLKSAGWPLAEIQQVDDYEDTGIAFRARVDHTGHDSFWTVLPTFTSPFMISNALLLFPPVGGLQQYRTIAVVTLYALSIMVRYIQSAWRRIEGGDEDQYLALVRASLTVWERVLPEHFLASIAGETVRTSQPGSFLA